MNRISFGILATLFVMMLVPGCSSKPDTGPVAALQEFYGHLNDGDYPEAMQLYDDKSRQVLLDPNTGSKEAFSIWALGETKNGSVDKVRVVKQEAGDKNATLDYEVVYSDGSTAKHTVTLTLESGAWKLSLIS